MTTASSSHRGIAGRAFERRFELADHIKVAGASLVNGLLHVDLAREVPEAHEAPQHQDRDQGGDQADRDRRQAASNSRPPSPTEQGRTGDRPASLRFERVGLGFMLGANERPADPGPHRLLDDCGAEI